ncbi:hypothetical protein DBB29_24980 [Pandoraea cepalis]|uniref:DUF4145 domain-containing protein n=2 Tax=Pandoraea cepalis TaxID=2508294 RepID=A0AAW7MGQ7_9BURK|nr:hypothetical protein [Pandoraea cepalis]MDN4581371.1 hypothetical protein [Pandoraea cepalis]
MELSKQDAAMHQLNVAIQLFLAGDYLASLTLAGAAEDIFAGLCRLKGLTTAADSIADFHVNDTDPALTHKERRGVLFKVMNRGRNQAKHANTVGEDLVDVDQIHPLQMLMRAMPMAESLGAVRSPEMRAMRSWVKEHPEAFE